MIYPNDYVEEVVVGHVLSKLSFNQNADEGVLMLAELLVKANAGYMNSHTEEAFMNHFNMTKKDRKLNKLGSDFICWVFYNHSNLRPPAYNLMSNFRGELA